MQAYKRNVLGTDIQGRSQNLRYIYPSIGSNWESSWNQHNCGSSGVYVTCIYCSLSVKINMRKNRTVTQDHGRICFTFAFVCVICRNLKTPNLCPMADNAITRGSIQGLGSLVYVCGTGTHAQLQQFMHKIDIIANLKLYYVIHHIKTGHLSIECILGY